MLYGNKLGFTLLLDLVIHPWSIKKLEIHHDAIKNCTLFLVTNYPMILIPRLIFSTSF